MPSDSVAFDRAAGYYDATRSLAPATSQAVTSLLLGEIGPGASVVEGGIGTGLVGLPLARAGVRVVGVDLARPMLEVLRNKDADTEVGVALADLTALPIRDHAADAALVSHVLHLIPAWRLAVDELVRVTRPGGRLLVNLGGHWGDSGDVHRRFLEFAGVERERVGIDTFEDDLLVEHLAARGATQRMLPAVTEERPWRPEERIAMLEQGLYSGVWSLDEHERQRAAQRTREWAVDRYGSLDAPRTATLTVQWRAFDLR